MHKILLYLLFYQTVCNCFVIELLSAITLFGFDSGTPKKKPKSGLDIDANN